MNGNKTIISLLLTLCFVTAIPMTFYFWKLPAAELLPAEKELIGFSSTPVAMSTLKPQPVFSGMNCPVKASIKQAITTSGLTTAGTRVPLPTTGPVAGQARPAAQKPQAGSLSSLPTVSMIYSEGDTNVAIIGGNILRAGSSFGAYHVVKIEKSRVLIRSAGKNIWLSMD